MLKEVEEYIVPLMSTTKRTDSHRIESWRARFSLTQVKPCSVLLTTDVHIEQECEVKCLCLYYFCNIVFASRYSKLIIMLCMCYSVPNAIM